MGNQQNVLKNIQDREFSEDGETMKMTLTITGKPAVTSIRVYKRLPALPANI